MIIRADSRLIPLADETAQMVCTSPPYWSLRDYQVSGQIGLERSIHDYIRTMVAVFEQVRRVLRPDGVCFVNIGDSYANSGACGGGSPVDARKPEYGRKGYEKDRYEGRESARRSQHQTRLVDGLKPKDLCLIPERLAIALQEAGWYVRSRIAWVKPAPMPESVTDRPTSAWEHIWMLTKSSSYYYDAEAVREAAVCKPSPETSRNHQGTKSSVTGNHANGGTLGWNRPELGRNLRNWWNIGPDPSSEAYCVACDVMFERSPKPPPKCVECGYLFIIEEILLPACPNCDEPHKAVCPRCHGDLTAHYAAFPRELVRKCVLAGSKPGSIVLDPFSGTGTTLLVAESLGRRAVGLELSWDYCRYSQRRNAQSSLFA